MTWEGVLITGGGFWKCYTGLLTHANNLTDSYAGIGRSIAENFFLDKQLGQI